MIPGEGRSVRCGGTGERSKAYPKRHTSFSRRVRTERIVPTVRKGSYGMRRVVRRSLDRGTEGYSLSLVSDRFGPEDHWMVRP